MWLREVVLVADRDPLRRPLAWRGDLREGAVDDAGRAPPLAERPTAAFYPAGKDHMDVFGKPPCYRCYLLTCWGEQSQDPLEPVVWRFRLEDPRTGQRRGFASLDALVAVLEREMAERSTDIGDTGNQAAYQTDIEA